MCNEQVMNYLNQSEKLFEEWKTFAGAVEYSVKNQSHTLTVDHKNSVFIRDGVVCPEQWFSQSVRPLFLLKEAYGGELDWNLVGGYLCNERQSISKNWQRVSQWTKGLIESTEDSPVPFVKNDSDTTFFGNEYLKKIAVINVRKSDGNKTSDMDIIRAYADFDKRRLKEQLEICDPTVIVCGNTASLIDNILDEQRQEIGSDNLAYRIRLNDHDVLVLDYWHPANRYPDIMNYYTLMSIYQNALKTIQ